MTSVLRWAAMRAILMFHNCEGQSRKTMPTDHNFWRQRRAKADSNRCPSAYQPNALPLGQTGSQESTVSGRGHSTVVISDRDWQHRRLNCRTPFKAEPVTALIHEWFRSSPTVTWPKSLFPLQTVLSSCCFYCGLTWGIPLDATDVLQHLAVHVLIEFRLCGKRRRTSWSYYTYYKRRKKKEKEKKDEAGEAKEVKGKERRRRMNMSHYRSSWYKLEFICTRINCALHALLLWNLRLVRGSN